MSPRTVPWSHRKDLQHSSCMKVPRRTSTALVDKNRSNRLLLGSWCLRSVQQGNWRTIQRYSESRGPCCKPYRRLILQPHIDQQDNLCKIQRLILTTCRSRKHCTRWSPRLNTGLRRKLLCTSPETSPLSRRTGPHRSSCTLTQRRGNIYRACTTLSPQKDQLFRNKSPRCTTGIPFDPLRDCTFRWGIPCNLRMLNSFETCLRCSSHKYPPLLPRIDLQGNSCSSLRQWC